MLLSGTGAYVVGTRKAVPTDEVQILPVRLIAPDSVQVGAPIPVGPTDPSDFMGTSIQAGHFLYVSSSARRDCRLRIFDLSTGHEAEPITVDVRRPNPVANEQEEPKCATTMSLRAPFLYVASPSYLTTFDVGDPAHPLVASRIDYHDTIPPFYGFARALVAQGNTLYEPAPWPQSLRSYSLHDPRHPLPQADLTWHSTGSTVLAASGSALYQPWRGGLIEFRREGSGFRALRYLMDGPRYRVNSLAIAGGFVYTLGYDKTLNQRRVAAFRVDE